MVQTETMIPQKRELVISRMIEAPRELVWRAWTDPERIKKWWGPMHFTAPHIHIDLRVGGKYLYCMRSPDGKDFWSTGMIREIVPLRKIVYTDSFADEEGNIVGADYYGMNPDFPLESMVTVSFEDHDHHTLLTIKYDDVSSFPEKDLKDMQAGWNESLDKLAMSVSW
jgi:uncharacterized protein YndB with AHSA1/START domain